AWPRDFAQKSRGFNLPPISIVIYEAFRGNIKINYTSSIRLNIDHCFLLYATYILCSESGLSCTPTRIVFSSRCTICHVMDRSPLVNCTVLSVSSSHLKEFTFSIHAS